MKNVIYSGIMGVVVGDALGVPFEFKQRDTFHCEGMSGYGTYNMPPGTWSDDSSMTLATVDSIAFNGGKVDPHDIMDRFARWLYLKEYTPYGSVFDVGNTTRAALDRYNSGTFPDKCGLYDEFSKGNGSLMRILPLVFAEFGNGDNVEIVSSLTHANPDCITACEIYVNIAEGLAAGEDLKTAMEYAALENYRETVFNRLENIETLSRDEIRSSGYVVDTLEAALWCLLHTRSYKEAVLTAVNLGSDTDTVAAVTGGLAGIMYGVGGETGIPEDWIDTLARKDWIEKLISKLDATIPEG